jgi:putative RecB family exonuclease
MFVRLEFMVLTKTKCPSVVRHPVVYGRLQVERTKHVVEHVWRAIENVHFFPNPSFQCSTCPYRRPCAEWRG